MEVPNIKFDKNSSTGSRAVICGRTDMTKPVVAFRNCTFAPNTRTQKEDTSSYTQGYGLLGETPLDLTKEYRSFRRILCLHLQRSRNETTLHEEFFQSQSVLKKIKIYLLRKFHSNWYHNKIKIYLLCKFHPN